MKQHGMSLCALASFVALSLPCLAQDNANPWNGSWKIDRSTLQYDGPTISVATDADGYTITRGGKASPKVICNGQPNAPVNGTTTTCTKAGTGYDLQNARDGKTVSKVKVEPSPDGQTMTRTVDVTPPDGSSPYTMTFVSKKLSGGDGAPTVWKEASFNESQDTGVLTILVHGDSVDFKETDNDKPITVKLDGTPTMMGTRGMAVKLADPHTLKVTYSNNGEVQRENTFVLSDDGKTIKETDVTPAPSPSTMTVMFNKS
jgi:hypothetical protein